MYEVLNLFHHMYNIFVTVCICTVYGLLWRISDVFILYLHCSMYICMYVCMYVCMRDINNMLVVCMCIFLLLLALGLNNALYSGAAWNEFNNYQYETFASQLMNYICSPSTGACYFFLFLVWCNTCPTCVCSFVYLRMY